MGLGVGSGLAGETDSGLVTVSVWFETVRVASFSSSDWRPSEALLLFCERDTLLLLDLIGLTLALSSLASLSKL